MLANRESRMSVMAENRNNQLRYGIVPKEYVRTCSGIIPQYWLSCKLGNVATITSGSTPNRNVREYWGGDVPWITTSELKGGYITSAKEFVSFKAISTCRLRIYPAGTLLMAMYGQGKTRGTVALLGIEATVNQACAAISDTKGDTRYFYYLLQFLYVNIRRLSNTGNQENLNADIIRAIPILLPPLPEQRKIAAILATQDKVIELYERKIEQLQLLKKNCLRKMFPRHGSDTPEVRFRGFTGTWERKRLGELFTEYAEKGHPELPALMTIQGGGTVRRDESDRNLQYDKHSLSNYKVANKGDFIVHLRSFEGGLEIVTTPGLISPAYHVFHGKKIDPRFYYAYFRSVDFIECDLKPHVYGIRDGRSIDIEGMKTIMIPHVSLKEQQAIGNCIESFDRLIALNQRKCDEEKQKKKALMQLLLTGIVRVGEAASCRLERAGNEAAGSRFSTRIAKV